MKIHRKTLVSSLWLFQLFWLPRSNKTLRSLSLSWFRTFPHPTPFSSLAPTGPYILIVGVHTYYPEFF